MKYFFYQKSLEETVEDGGVIYSNTLSFNKLFIFFKKLKKDEWMKQMIGT